MRALCYAQTNIGSGRDNNEDNYYCNGTFKRDPPSLWPRRPPSRRASG